MKIAEFINRIISEFGFQPTHDQELALFTFGRFLADRSPNAVMLMRGSAGTGKTSLAAAMVRTLRRLGQKLVLMAPTGRAAKVFSMNSGMTAFTIHRRIYREKNYAGIDGQFNLNDNLYHNTLFVVDEASMIGRTQGESAFGSGSLLDDLVRYVYNGDNCRLLLIGDRAQLPPIGEAQSPALNADIMAGYGLEVYQCDLMEVLRQGRRSGILYNATVVRDMMTQYDSQLRQSSNKLLQLPLPKIRFRGFADVVRVPGNELVEQIATSYSEVGIDSTIVITRSNKRANLYNQGIRNQVLDREDALCGGDLLMVVKNKYEGEGKGERSVSFIANGDRVEVERVRNMRELYGFHFADCRLQFPDYDDTEMETTVLMDTLTSESPSLTHEQSELLYNKVLEDYQDVPLKADRMKALKADDYYNALQIKFAYAVTCHKAQGGQWQHVYVDQGYMTDDMLSFDYLHWLYTAMTRATDKLFLVNWPDTQIEL